MEVTKVLRLRVPLPDLAQMVGGDVRQELDPENGRKWVFESANIYNSFMELVDSYVEIELKEVRDV